MLKFFLTFILPNEPAARGLTKTLHEISESFTFNLRIFMKIYTKFMTNFGKFDQISENLLRKFMGNFSPGKVQTIVDFMIRGDLSPPAPTLAQKSK